MKLLKAEVNNFGSYKHLELDFSNLGLCLIQGPTGSGKSTIQDVIPWILFGVTAKGGNADEIKSWTTGDGDYTYGALQVSHGATLQIYRVRGKPNQNDLYWTEGDSEKQHRGKDIKETQSLLNKRLGISEYLYLAAAYYSETSPTGNFFLAKAKDKRELFEKLADLDLPVSIAEGVTNERRESKRKNTVLLADHARAAGRSEEIASQYTRAVSESGSWGVNQKARLDILAKNSSEFDRKKHQQIAELRSKIEAFELKKTKSMAALVDEISAIDLTIDAICTKCGQPHAEYQKNKLKETQLITRLENLSDQQNPHHSELKIIENSKNYYIKQIEEESVKLNPFTSQMAFLEKEQVKIKNELDEIAFQINETNHKLMSLDQLYDLSLEMRGHQLKRSIKKIETSTNAFLQEYFESDLRVSFEFEESDDLEVTITKNGHIGVYRQLSKGQQSLLRLCFSIAVMEYASNISGVHFDTLCFDEALNGPDPELKVKSFRLFEKLSLSHGSVIVIEHASEFKSLFSKVLEVELINDESHVREI